MNSNVPLKVQEAIFNQILERPDNKVCADCPNKSPTWASIDFGVFVCLRCSGAHRRLSPVVTRVRSAKIDSWLMDHIEMMAATGNKIANDYWEATMPSSFKKPDLSTSLEDVFEMVKIKYVKALYAAKDCLNPVKEFLEARKDGQTTAGSFSQAKLGQKPEAKQVTQTTTTTTPITKTVSTNKPAETKAPTQNLIDLDDDFGDFKSAPVNNIQMDISKPEVEVKFVSSTQKSAGADLWNSAFENNSTSSNANLQKARSADPFSFEQPQNPPPTQTQRANSASNDSNKLYDLYKTGNQDQQKTIQSVSGQNFTGGQSNYAYLDGFGSQQNQQNRFGQPQQQQGFGFQSGMNGQAPKNQYYGGVQAQPTGFGGQTNFNKPSGGFDFGGSTNSFSSGGFGGNNTGFGSSGNGFNSFGTNGANSGSFNSFGKQQQPPQPFSYNQGFNTMNSTQNLNQPTSVNTGFSFF